MTTPIDPKPRAAGRPIQGRHKRQRISTTISQDTVDYIDRLRVVLAEPDLTPGRVFDRLVNLTKGAEGSKQD